MFESWEDLVEQSVDLNHRAVPFIHTLINMVNNADDLPQPLAADLQAYTLDLIEFINSLNIDEEGVVITDGLEERKIH